MREEQQDIGNGDALIDYEAIPYAGFGIRVVATLIDGVVLLPLVGLNYQNIFTYKQLWAAWVLAILSAAYKPLMEYFRGATFGKMVVKIKVVNYRLKAISFGQALIRYLPWMFGIIVNMLATVSIFHTEGFSDVNDFESLNELAESGSYQKWTQFALYIVPVSAFGILFNVYRQAVHDQLAKTFCVYISSPPPPSGT